MAGVAPRLALPLPGAVAGAPGHQLHVRRHPRRLVLLPRQVRLPDDAVLAPLSPALQPVPITVSAAL
jgi:hypothetical protein